MKDVNSEKLSRGTQTPRSCSCSRSPAVIRAIPPVGGALPPLQMRPGGGAVHPNQSRTVSPRRVELFILRIDLSTLFYHHQQKSYHL